MHIKILGDVSNVLNGNVESSIIKPIDNHQFRFALGAGSFSTPERTGETIIINSSPYISWIENNELKTETQPYFHSPFLIGIAHDQHIDNFNLYNPTGHATLQSLYEKLAQQYPDGCAILGQAVFKQMHITYIKKPPIFHENINDHQEEYWAEIEPQENTEAYFFGVILPEAAKNKYPADRASKAFYKNPKDKQTSTISSHTHAAIINAGDDIVSKDKNEFINSMNKISISGVRHLLTPSVINVCVYTVFPFNGIDLKGQKTT